MPTSSRAPALHASVRPISSAPHNARLVAAIAAGELRAIFSASSCAASRSRSGGSTTSLIIPSSYARCADMRSYRPTNAMRITASTGMRFIRPIASIDTTCPIEVCGSKNCASDAAITMSESAIQWKPPPAQMPLTAVITGFHTSLCQAVKWKSNFSTDSR